MRLVDGAAAVAGPDDPQSGGFAHAAPSGQMPAASAAAPRRGSFTVACNNARAPYRGVCVALRAFRSGGSRGHAPRAAGTGPQARCDGAGRLAGMLPDVPGRLGEPGGYVGFAERAPGDELPERDGGAPERGVVLARSGVQCPPKGRSSACWFHFAASSS